MWGSMLALYAAMQFIFSPVLGVLSDRFGRRPVLLLSLAGRGDRLCAHGVCAGAVDAGRRARHCRAHQRQYGGRHRLYHRHHARGAARAALRAVPRHVRHRLHHRAGAGRVSGRYLGAGAVHRCGRAQRPQLSHWRCSCCRNRGKGNREARFDLEPAQSAPAARLGVRHEGAAAADRGVLHPQFRRQDVRHGAGRCSVETRSSGTALWSACRWGRSDCFMRWRRCSCRGRRCSASASAMRCSWAWRARDCAC